MEWLLLVAAALAPPTSTDSMAPLSVVTALAELPSLVTVKLVVGMGVSFSA
jgi:hypothetical protein